MSEISYTNKQVDDKLQAQSENNDLNLFEMFRAHAVEDTRRFDQLQNELHINTNLTKELHTAIAPLSEAYQGVLFGKKLLTGIAAVVLAIAAIGGGVIWLINAAVTKNL